MRRRFVAAAVALFLSLACLAAQNLKISVMDFSLESDNPQFKYLGKGFTELISVEVARLPGFTLVDRERRNTILKEQEFALSGAADESGAMQIGQLLSVDYLVVGSIIDMMGTLIVSYSIVRTDTGAVVGKLAAEGAPTEYKRIVKNIGVGIATMTGKETAVAKAAPPPPPPVAKQAEVLTSFSDAVAALDVKDVKTATAKLKEAKRIDPTDPAVTAYLAKLITNTTKFKILMESYFSYLNPAFLGIMRQDVLHLAGSMPVVPVYFMPLIEGVNYTSYGSNRYITETVSASQLGYALPLGEDFGLRLSIHQASLDVRAKVGARPVSNGEGGIWDDSYARGAMGVNIDLGMKIGNSFAVGGGAALFARSERDTNLTAPFAKNDGATWAVDLGFLIRNADESLVWDTRVGYVSETQELLNPLTLAMLGTTRPFPLSLENNLSLALADRTFFIVLKNTDAVSLSGEFFSGSLMPAAEFFIQPWFSVRGGVEASILTMNGHINPGLGGMAGITFRVIPWGMDIDLNVSYRMRPSSAVPGFVYPDFLLLLNLNLNGVFIKDR
jgi:TolB-like protein